MSLHRDTPPGHRRFKFGSWFDGRTVPWWGEPGDPVLQVGPRIGQRFWIVADVEPLKKWATVLLAPALRDEFLVAIEENEGRGWQLTPRFITPHGDLATLVL